MRQSKHMAKIEQWQIDDAARLKVLIERHLADEMITQAEFTSRCGWSQSMIHQYTKPLRSLGLETVAIFAQTLDVPIDKISPRLAHRIRELYGLVDVEKVRKQGTN